MNCICVAVELAAINFYGTHVYGLDKFPEWAETTNATVIAS